MLPGDYVRDEVALAHAVTIHKAQGVTVDRSILLVDDRTTAEGLYVGMTRGRASNMPWPSARTPTMSIDRQAGLEARRK